MDKRAYVTGLGGQGVMLIAKLYIKGGFSANKDVLMYPTYGGEQRGGASNAAIMVSDTKVGAPNVAKFDVSLFMHQNAYNLAPDCVKDGGIAIINSALVTETKDNPNIRKVYIDATAEAVKLGSERASNMVMLGALTVCMDAIGLDDVLESMRHEMAKKPQFIELNENAIRKGAELAKAQL